MTEVIKRLEAHGCICSGSANLGHFATDT
jgi:hypothetical protein